MNKSSGELRARKTLKKLGLKFKEEFQPIFWRKFRVDFVFKIGEKQIALEIDGDNVHGLWRYITYDYHRDRKIINGSGISKIYRIRYKNLEKDIKSIVKKELYLYYITKIIKLAMLLIIGYFALNSELILKYLN